MYVSTYYTKNIVVCCTGLSETFKSCDILNHTLILSWLQNVTLFRRASLALSGSGKYDLKDFDILLWENNMCSLGKQDKDNCQHFIDRGIKHHVCPKKPFCFFSMQWNFPFYKRQGLIYKILLLKWGLYKKLVFYRKHAY